ncbi:MAG: hypothetical protein IPK16_09745 [Anaerolineales bacterium]|nr:hypothetical protein [Anaerolineales bacterium]
MEKAESGSDAPASTSVTETDATETDAYDVSWYSSLLRPTLVVVMVTCLGVAVFAFMRQYAPAFPAAARWAILALIVISGVIGVVSTTWLAHPKQRIQRSATYRVADLGLLLLSARVVLWLAQGSLPDPATFFNQANEVFLDGPFLVTGLAMACAWVSAIDFTGDLMQLGLQADELHETRLTRNRYVDTSRPASADRTTLLHSFVTRWVLWGIFLILIASALRLGVTRNQFWTLAHQDVDPVVVSVIIIYFLSGLILISQGQLALLRARWTLDRVPTQTSIQRNWPFYTVIVLAGFAVISVFLPLGDTFLLSQVLTFILNTTFNVVSFIFQLVSLLLVLLFSLLPFSSPPEAPPPTPEPMQATPPPPLILDIPPWIGGAFFWATIVVLFGLAAYFYFSDKETNLRWLRRLLDALRMQWLALWSGWQSWQRSIVRALGGTPQSTGATGEKERRWWPFRWGALSPAMLDKVVRRNKPTGYARWDELRKLFTSKTAA